MGDAVDFVEKFLIVLFPTIDDFFVGYHEGVG